MMLEDDLKNVSVNGDIRDVIKHIPQESIHLIFTSPPYYNAREYSQYDSYEDYLKFMEGIFVELNRITKEGRYFVLNTSPIIETKEKRHHRSKRLAIPYDLHPLVINSGWEFIDDIFWVKPSGASLINRNGNFGKNRKPLVYKPNPVVELLMVYRKKTDKLIDWNIKQYDKDIVEKSKVIGEYETTNVWKIHTESDDFHSAVFPIKLCNNIIQFYSFVGDLVFDPFAGRGTVGMSALRLNRYFLLVEKNAKHFRLINKNIMNESTSFFYNGIAPLFFDFDTWVDKKRKF